MKNWLLKTFLPQGSSFELFLRTLYHRINATKPVVNYQLRQAQRSYIRWRELQKNQVQPQSETPVDFPSVTFILEINNGEEAVAQETLHSIIRTGGRCWKVLPIFTTGDTSKFDFNVTGADALLPSVSGVEALPAIDGLTDSDFLCLCRAGDLFDFTLAVHFKNKLLNNPNADVYYYDCEIQQHNAGSPLPFFKPSALSPELMFSINYLSRGFIRRSSLAGKTKPQFPVLPLLAYEYDLMLNLVEQKSDIVHIAHVLASLMPDNREQGVAIDSVIENHLRAKGYNEVSIGHINGQRKINWQTGDPSVSIIILSYNHGDWLRALVHSIFEVTDYSNYSLVIVDNASTDTDVLQYYSELKANQRVKIVPYNKPFNYSEAINTGAANAEGEIIVILNNDMQIIEANWLRELVQWAAQPGIGVVGAKLLHRNRSIQHAGIILGMNGFVGHLYLNAPENYHGLAGSVDWYRNFNALTGACQAVSRDLFHQVGGYDERFRLVFGDIDFCLRVIDAGLRNLFNPHSVIIHYKGGSRGYETPADDTLLGFRELAGLLQRDDLYFSPNLTYTRIPQCNLPVDSSNKRLARIRQREQRLTQTRKSK